MRVATRFIVLLSLCVPACAGSSSGGVSDRSDGPVADTAESAAPDPTEPSSPNVTANSEPSVDEASTEPTERNESELEPTAVERSDIDLAGETLRIVGPFDGPQESAFRAIMDVFALDTGAAYTYEFSDDVLDRMQTSTPDNRPDVFLNARPGHIEALVNDGLAIDLASAGVDIERMERAYSSTAIQLGLVNGVPHGVLSVASSKSLFFYRTENLDALGAVPATLDELVDDFDEGASVALAGAPRWPLTDWFENIFLRTAGPDEYSALFKSGTKPWTDPDVAQAADTMVSLLDDDTLAGGVEPAVETDLISAFTTAIDGEADVFLGGGFMVNFASVLRPEAEPGVDYDIFDFPPIEAGPNPLILGGTFAVPTNDSPAVAGYFDWFASSRGADALTQLDSIDTVLPNLLVEVEAVENPIRRAELESIRSAQTIVFDGSDLLPRPVEQALFDALAAIVLDPASTPEALASVEAAAAAVR